MKKENTHRRLLGLLLGLLALLEGGLRRLLVAPLESLLVDLGAAQRQRILYERQETHR